MKFVKYNLPYNQTRPALVLDSFSESALSDPSSDPHLNLTVFLDGCNDVQYHELIREKGGSPEISADGLLAHVYSAPRGTEPGTWQDD